jgi:hypothetical protein
LVTLTHKIDTLITLITFLKKCEKDKGGLHVGTKGVHHLLNEPKKSTFAYTPSVPISKHPFDFIFVHKCKPLFKLLDAFIIFFPKHTPN